MEVFVDILLNIRRKTWIYWPIISWIIINIIYILGFKRFSLLQDDVKNVWKYIYSLNDFITYDVGTILILMYFLGILFYIIGGWINLKNPNIKIGVSFASIGTYLFLYSIYIASILFSIVIVKSDGLYIANYEIGFNNQTFYLLSAVIYLVLPFALLVEYLFGDYIEFPIIRRITDQKEQ